MIDRGELGHVRVGQRRVRVRQSQLDAFLAAGEPGRSLPRPLPDKQSATPQTPSSRPSKRKIGMPSTGRYRWRTPL
jgi:hypothetical protein